MPGALVYDGDCDFCTRSVRLLSRLDTRRQLTFIPLQDPDLPRRHPGLDPAALQRAMHLILPDGRVLAGAEALPHIARMLPLGRPFSLLFRLPGVMDLADRLYRLVARNRHRLGCRSSSCERR